MKTIEINGHLRGSIGSKSAKQLRREGQVPCVIYGGEENIHLHADERELNKLIYTPHVFLITLKLGDKEYSVVMREPQYHPVSDKLIHLDFVEVVPGRPVSIMLPVTLTGNAIGVRNGGVLRRNAKKLMVRGMINDIPEEISLDITNMRIGNSTKVGDLSFAGIEFLEAANRVVVAIKTSRKAIADEEEEEEGEGEEGAEGAEEGGEGGGEEKAEAPAES